MGGVTVGNASLGFLGYLSITNAHEVKDLLNEGTNIGGSISAVLPYVGSLIFGSDFNFVGDVTKNPYSGYFGMTFSIGPGVGKEFHVQTGMTDYVGKPINLFELWDYIYYKYKSTECEGVQ